MHEESFQSGKTSFVTSVSHFQIDTQHRYMLMLTSQKRFTIPTVAFADSTFFYDRFSACSKVPKQRMNEGDLGACASSRDLQCYTKNCASIVLGMQSDHLLEDA